MTTLIVSGGFFWSDSGAAASVDKHTTATSKKINNKNKLYTQRKLNFFVMIMPFSLL
jgi:hypothetical protein